MTEIVPGIFLGSESHSRDLSFLISKRITHILSLGSNFTEEFPHQFKYKIVAADANPNFDFYKHFDSIADFIQEGKSGNNRVYIHCGSGAGKGSTALLAFFIKKENKTLREGLATIRVKFPQANPQFSIIFLLIF